MLKRHALYIVNSKLNYIMSAKYLHENACRKCFRIIFLLCKRFFAQFTLNLILINLNIIIYPSNQPNLRTSSIAHLKLSISLI